MKHIPTLLMTALAVFSLPMSAQSVPDTAPAASDRLSTLSQFVSGNVYVECRFTDRAKGIAERAIVTAYKNGRIGLRLKSNGRVIEMADTAFTEEELTALRDGIRHCQEAVKALACQHGTLGNGHNTKPVDLTTGAYLRKASDLGSESLPPKSVCLYLRGMNTTAIYELPIRVKIVWYGAQSPDAPKIDRPGGALVTCKTHVRVQEDKYVLQGRDCSFYSDPVRRCDIECTCSQGMRYKKYIVLIYNDLTDKLIYTNAGNEAETKKAAEETNTASPYDPFAARETTTPTTTGTTTGTKRTTGRSTSSSTRR